MIILMFLAPQVGFTPLSASMDARSLVGILNDIFGLWDQTAEKFGLEKIKTIGDCYMAAAGVPTACADHAQRCARMGLAMQKDLAQYPLRPIFTRTERSDAATAVSRLLQSAA